MAMLAERKSEVVHDFTKIQLTPDPEVARRIQETLQPRVSVEPKYIHPALATAAILTGGAALVLAPAILKVIDVLATK
jgi:hypothetical protein